MKRRNLSVAALLLLTVVGAAWAQGGGGAFVPTFPYVIPAQWTWTRLTPWVVKASQVAQYATSFVVSAPTANRTITFPDATGVLGANVNTDPLTKSESDTITLSGPNPINLTTNIASLKNCQGTLVGGTAPGLDPVLITLSATAGQSIVSVYAWKFTSSSVTTLIASSTSGRQVYLACQGT